MIDKSPSNTMATFSTALGWFALLGSLTVIRRLVFGYASQEAALAALGPSLTARSGTCHDPLIRRLEAFAEGNRDDFADIEVDPGPRTTFQDRVLRRCRRIAYGDTLAYGQLAADVGHPGAARAVGQCMATNRIPLIVPCHRVVGSNGGLGGYSAIGGLAIKRHLLDLENRTFSNG